MQINSAHGERSRSCIFDGPRKSERLSKSLSALPLTKVEPGVEWREYIRIKPGTYPAYCRWAKQYRDGAYHRWTCLLRFDVLSADLVNRIATIPKWFNLGNGAKPLASRRGQYFMEWIRANNGPPGRADRLSPNVFLKRIAQVLIVDTKSAVPYSVVHKILSWETGESRVIQSISHTVMAGIFQMPREQQLTKKQCQSFEAGASALAGVEGVVHSNPHPRDGRAETGSLVKGNDGAGHDPAGPVWAKRHLD